MQAQNSVAERTWRTIFSATLRMLEDAALPASNWKEAAKTAAYVKNRIFSYTMDNVHDGRITSLLENILYQYHPPRSLDRFQALSDNPCWIWAALSAQAPEGEERLKDE